MLKRLYSWLYKATGRPDEKGEYSGGLIQGIVRDSALRLCRGQSGRALEIGTGTGLFLARLAHENPRLKISSIDTNDAYLDRASAKLRALGVENVRLLHQDAQEMSFDNESFDLVICINLFLDVGMEYMIRVLNQMRRVSKPSGRIIFEFRSSRNALFKLKYKLARHYDPSAPYPLYTYDPNMIDRILKDMDLRIVKKTYIGFPIRYFAPIIMVEAGKN